LKPRDPEPQSGADEASVRPRANDPADTDEVEATHVRPAAPAPGKPATKFPVAESGDRVLGVVVVYSETHASAAGDVDPRLGRVYPLKAGEILLVGRHPPPAEVLGWDGESRPPTYCHLFPHGGIYQYISRRHLTVEMDPLGGAILTDTSLHGIYLQKAGKWHRRRDRTDPPESHRIMGPEVVILGDDLGKHTDQDLADRRSRYCLHVLPAVSR
jgi:hypothetical protein